MKRDARKLDGEQRQALVGHISRHLADLDDQTLLSLADLTREAALDVETVSVAGGPVTRRRFLTATLAGGFVAATAGAVAVWQYGSGRGRELNDELERLWGLVDLYKRLDDVGLDRLVVTGLAAVGATLEAMAVAAELVNTGAQTVEDALRKVEAAFPPIRAGLAWLESLVSDLSQRLHLLEDAIGRAINEVNPLTQALAPFFDFVLKVLPLDIGQRVREVLERLGATVNLIPQAIADINVKILTPLRDDWFSDSPGKGIKGALIEPVITQLLDPIEAMTGRLSALLHDWEAELATPAKNALSQRETIYKEITEYKAHYRLLSPQREIASG